MTTTVTPTGKPPKAEKMAAPGKPPIAKKIPPETKPVKQPSDPAEHELAAADVLDANQSYYSLDELESLLRIPVASIREAHAGGVYFRTSVGDIQTDTTARVNGSVVLNWIERENIAYDVTYAGRELYEKNHPPTKPTSMRELEPRDVLSAIKWHRVDAIVALLGIPLETIQQAAKDDIFKSTRHHPESEHHGELYGKEVLAWIYDNKIPYTVTDAGRKAYEAAHPPPPPKTLLELAAESAEQEKANEAEMVVKCKRLALIEYIGLLRRYKTPRDGDANRLSQLLQDPEFKLSIEQVKTDVHILQRYDELHARHAGLNAASKRSIEAREADRALQERHKQETIQSLRAKRTAESHHSDCHGAAWKLSDLRKSRPDLFEREGELPRLLSDDGLHKDDV